MFAKPNTSLNLNSTFTIDEFEDQNNQSFCSSSWLESGNEFDMIRIQKEILSRD